MAKLATSFEQAKILGIIKEPEQIEEGRKNKTFFFMVQHWLVQLSLAYIL